MQNIYYVNHFYPTPFRATLQEPDFLPRGKNTVHFRIFTRNRVGLRTNFHVQTRRRVPEKPLLTGFLARFFLRRHEPAERPHFPSGLRPIGMETFTGAVSTAATGMLTVCAYVVFFSALTGALGCMAAKWSGLGPAR